MYLRLTQQNLLPRPHLKPQYVPRRLCRPSLRTKPNHHRRAFSRIDSVFLPRMMNRRRVLVEALNLNQYWLSLTKHCGHEKTAPRAKSKRPAPLFRRRGQNANHLVVALKEHFLEAEGAKAGTVDVRATG